MLHQKGWILKDIFIYSSLIKPFVIRLTYICWWIMIRAIKCMPIASIAVVLIRCRALFLTETHQLIEQSLSIDLLWPLYPIESAFLFLIFILRKCSRCRFSPVKLLYAAQITILTLQLTSLLLIIASIPLWVERVMFKITLTRLALLAMVHNLCGLDIRSR